MGNFYVNYTLRGPPPADVAVLLKRRYARVTPEHNGCIVVFDEESDKQDQKEIAKLAAKLSKKFACPCLAVLNHDDDILWYRLYLNGKLADEYDSTPGYFNAAAAPAAPAGGDAVKLCAAYGGDPVEVAKILQIGYAFAVDRHAALVKAVGISDYAVGTAYASFDNDEYPDGLTAADVLNTREPAKARGKSCANDPNVERYKNVIELYQAAAKNAPAAVRRAVVDLRVDPGVTEFAGQTPLHNACITSSLDAAKTLIELGADPKQRYTYESMSGGCESNRTTLMYAGSAEVVRLLLDHGADPNAADDAGYTPLMHAAKRRDIDAVELLLAAGADPVAKARLHNGGYRKPSKFAAVQLAFYEAQSSEPEMKAAIDKARRVVDRLTAAEKQAAEE